MSRTTTTAVQSLLGDDYGLRADGTLPDLQQFIDSATVIVDRVETGASAKGFDLTTAELELIERWLSAHMYVQNDQNLASKSTGGASASFQGQTGQGFAGSKYGLTAMRLDYSGLLRNIDLQQRAGIVWLGKPPSQQTPIDERD